MSAVTATAEEAQRIIDDEALEEEKLLEELENEDIPSHIREARLDHFKEQAKELHYLQEKGHGTYSEVMEERQFLAMTTSEQKCVVHFFHEDFRRCLIMDEHLKGLSEKYYETKFAKINVEKAKFFVQKLKIQVLPAVICFVNGMVVDRIVGFEELGNTDAFPTEILERRLASSKVINAKDLGSENKSTSIFGKSSKKDDSDDDDDW